MTKDELEFLIWKAERAEQARKIGAYWLTTEGRNELRDCFPDHDDGNSVRPLLDYVERLEKLQMKVSDLMTPTFEAVAEERERCARICETLMWPAEHDSGPEAAGWLERAARLIRDAQQFEYQNEVQAAAGGLTQTAIE